MKGKKEKREHSLVERFQGSLAADGIAEERREKIKQVLR